MQASDYAVFILTHGRPNNVITYNTLRRSGYSGKIYLIIDDEDKCKNEYFDNYPNEVIVFSKTKYHGTFDIMDNFDGNKVIVYARNACNDIARKLKLKYFFEFEDDYTRFQFRYVRNNEIRSLSPQNIKKVFLSMIRCVESTGVDTLAMAQGGDIIGGIDSYYAQNFKRKAMNTFCFKVKEKKDDIIFIGRMNDDVNTYLTLGKIGKMFIHFTDIQVVQKQTQSNAGGNTDAYLKYGTYVKSFYSVMAEPSCCKISFMGSAHRRIHHKIKWENAVPKIIREVHKK